MLLPCTRVSSQHLLSFSKVRTRSHPQLLEIPYFGLMKSGDREFDEDEKEECLT